MMMTAELPVLVLLPGLDGTGDLFQPVLWALGGRFDTVIVRYPVDHALDYTELLPIARAALPAHRPFVILAESFSGPIGISLAAHASPDLRGLVLCGSFARNPRPALRWLARWVNAVPINSALISAAVAAMLGRSVEPSIRALIERAVARVSPSALRRRLQSVLRVDVRADLPKFDAPILYLQAMRDRAVPSSAADLIRQIRPDAKVARIDGPHFLLQASADAAAEEIARFVLSVAPNVKK